MSWLSRQHRVRHEIAHGQAPGLPMVWRTFGGIAALVSAANIAGIVVVALLLLALNTDATRHQRIVVGVVGGAYGACAVAFGAVMAFVVQGRTLKWLAKQRTPTRDEARRALRNPLDLALLTGALWLLGAVISGSLGAAVGGNARQLFGLCSGLVLAGLTTAGVTYVIAAAFGRPITVIALSVYPPTESVIFTLRARMLVSWLVTTGIPVVGIILILASPPDPHSHVVGAALFTAFVAMVVGASSAGAVARSIGEPLRELVTVLERVGRSDLSGSVQVNDVGEIGMLQRGVNEMIAGLRERERIQDLFGRHVGSAVAAEAIAGGTLGAGEQREVVALFVDIAGSTRLTRNTEPAEFVAMLNRFFSGVVDAVHDNGGLVNKFEGDAALCVFGAPIELHDPSTAALRAARTIRDRVERDGELHVGIGVAAGAVVAGYIGADSRMEYTVIGDAVNEAARLTELAKEVDGAILASDTTVESSTAGERRFWVKGRAVRLRGRDAPTNTYRSPVTADL